MEDLCGDCRRDWRNGDHHIDVWMGPQHRSSGALIRCEDRLTRDSTDVITDPSSDLSVDTTPLFDDGDCSANTH
jgi:hypothetical protein